MDLEQLKLWRDSFEKRRSAEILAAETLASISIREFVMKFRTHALHGRTWRPIPYWSHPGIRAVYRGHRIWVEFQLSKKSMERLLA